MCRGSPKVRATSRSEQLLEQVDEWDGYAVPFSPRRKLAVQQTMQPAHLLYQPVLVASAQVVAAELRGSARHGL